MLEATPVGAGVAMLLPAPTPDASKTLSWAFPAAGYLAQELGGIKNPTDLLLTTNVLNVPARTSFLHTGLRRKEPFGSQRGRMRKQDYSGGTSGLLPAGQDLSAAGDGDTWT